MCPLLRTLKRHPRPSTRGDFYGDLGGVIAGHGDLAGRSVFAADEGAVGQTGVVEGR